MLVLSTDTVRSLNKEFMETKLSLKELQHIELEVLRSFHVFCEENKLTYYLTAGTLLGAIRHNGFIPWDDDIDIVMPRPDYERFLQLFEQKNTVSYLKLATPKNTPNYYVPMAKLFDSRFGMEEPNLRFPCPLGPWIDIFPLDNMGNEYEEAVSFFKKVGVWRVLRCLRMLPSQRKGLRRFARNCVTAVLSILPSAYFLNKINQVSRQYEDAHFTKYVCVVCMAGYGLKELFEGVWYQKRELHAFGPYQFYIPCGWHKILTRFYGDYMTPRKRDYVHFDL